MPRSLRLSHMIDLLKSEAGVINATGSIVGLAALTAVGGVAASSVSGLLPVAQDSAAQQNAAQIGTAQGLARIMDGKFTDLEGLEAGAYLPAHRAATGPRRFDTTPGQDGSCFVVVSRSATGQHFFVTDVIPTPEPLVDPAGTGCLDAGTVWAMADGLDAAAAGS